MQEFGSQRGDRAYFQENTALFSICCRVTKMAVDQVCVVTNSNPRQCQNQDILFLGTGKYYIPYTVFLLTMIRIELCTVTVFSGKHSTFEL